MNGYGQAGALRAGFPAFGRPAPRFLPDMCYLLSALCMLGGCLMLSHALEIRPGRLAPLAGLIGALQFYEWLVTALALFLAFRKESARDARLLLGIEALFLADLTFLNAEFLSADPWSGAAVAAGSLLMGAGRVAMVLGRLRIEWPARLLGFYGAAFAILLAFPGVLTVAVRAGFDARFALYWAWWAAGLLLPLRAAAGPADASAGHPAGRAFRRVIDFGLLISFPAHLLAASWMYQIPFYPGSLTPVLLGAALWIALARPAGLPAEAREAIAWIFPAAAVLLSIQGPPEWIAALTPGHGPALSPLRLALVAAGLVHLAGIFTTRRLRFAVPAALYLGAAVAGHTVPAIFAAVGRSYRWMTDLLPDTLGEWGAISVISAFGFLLVGARASLRRKDSAELPPPAPPAPPARKPEPPPAPPRSAPKSGTSWLAWTFLAIILGFMTLVLLPSILRPRRGGWANETAAIGTLRTILSTESAWRQNDMDGDGIADFWVADVWGLYACADGAGNPTKAVDIAVGKSDVSPLNFSPPGPRPFHAVAPPPAPVAKSGYLVEALQFDEDGRPFAQDLNGDGKACENPARFGFRVTPEVYGTTGVNTYIVNEEGVIYGRDLGWSAVGTPAAWPGKDPTTAREPWRVVQ